MSDRKSAPWSILTSDGRPPSGPYAPPRDNAIRKAARIASRDG
ncbi:hypothetical protein [Streptomyces sp. NBC_00212]